MASIQQLISISSSSIAPKPSVFPSFLHAYALGSKLFHMLEQKNGFYDFESALRVVFNI
jgi:hypothetical protein